MNNTLIQIKIDNFEGPLDLLLHLIDKKQMKITEINISQIIDDYLKYIKEQKELNLKIKVEFLIMATELIEIKAYSILNKEKKEEKIEDLEKRIIEYKFFKEISELFSKSENEYNIPYKRSGTQKIETAIIEYDLSKLTLDNIVKSFREFLKEDKKDMLILNLEEEYSTNDAKNEIYEIIEKENKVEFSIFFKSKFTKTRIVTIFLTILDLFKIGEIDISFEKDKFYISKIINNIF